jgi:ATP-dependent Clp protease ATP-binding subunit ClpB
LLDNADEDLCLLRTLGQANSYTRGQHTGLRSPLLSSYRLFIDQLFTNQLFIDQLFINQLFINQLFINQLFINQLWLDGRMADQSKRRSVSNKNGTAASVNNNKNQKLEPLSFNGIDTSPEAALRGIIHRHDEFSILTLATAFWERCSYDAIKQYLQHSYKDTMVLALKYSLVHGHHIMLYALHHNDADCIRLLLEYGVDPGTRDSDKIPSLAFAIMRSSWSHENHLEAIKALLAGGADPHVIPRDMWHEYVKAPSASISSDLLDRDAREWWCRQHFRDVLSKTLDLSIRYNLWKASRLPVVKQGQRQLAKAKNIVSLFQIPYVIVGQELAAQMVMRCIFGHIAMNKPSPLVLAFVGLSGHGKTELASQMGHFLSTDFLDIDCTQQSNVFTLIGAPPPYQGSQDGTPLNNFLVRNAGKRCVVFLDEYDKTEQPVRDALLKTMDAGMCALSPFAH